MWRRTLLAGTVVAAIAVVIGTMQAWRGGPVVGLFEGSGPSAEQLSAWLDHSLVVAHDASQPGGTDIDGWEADRIEVCGDSVIAFFDRGGDGSDGYLWAVGRPASLPDGAMETGWSRTLSSTDVARRRAELPVCDVALEGAPDHAGADLLLAPHVVVRVPEMFWAGRPEDAPVEVEIVGGDRDAIVDVGIARDAYLVARIDDASIRAVDLVTPDGKLRYTVGPPGFTLWANVADESARFELLDEHGDVLRAGPIIDWPGAEEGARQQEAVARQQAEQLARQAADAARRAAAERRGGEALSSGQTCRDWHGLSSEAQVLLTEELILDRVEAVRATEQLADAATFTEIAYTAQARVDESCGEPPMHRFVTEVVEALYPDE